MMKSPSEQVDPTNINSMNQMNPGRRMSWQGQYQVNQVSQPQHHQSSDGQPPGPPQYYPEKMDMFPTPPSSYPASTVANTGVDQWQNPSSSGVGVGQYAHSESSPAQSNSHYGGEHREPNSGVNSNGMSGAAAAAAAAMAAAAHTAKGSPVYQKPANSMSPLLNAVHKPSPMPPAQRAASFHPNYANVQSGVPPQNAAPPPGDPTVPNHAYPPSQPPHPMNRPPNPTQYGQWASPQSNAMEHRPSPGYQHGFDSQPIPGPERVPSYASDSIGGPMSNASSHDSEESRTKTVSARSTSQKLSALYEPDEPGRKEFIDSVLQYWEDKDLPLKHAPMMGGRTLDLFNLYQHVRNRGFMQEVSRSKKWTEISNTMGLGTTSASGFTLKKQYCKYLFGFECRTERQEPEPQEALGRVLEANRKKKQLADQSHAKATDNSHYGEIPPPNMMHHQHSMPRPPPQHHPGPMGYHHQQMPGYHHGYPGHGHSVHNPMAGPYEQQSYGGPVNSGWQQQNPHHYPPSRPMSQPRYSYRPNGIPPPTHPQAGPPMSQVYPNIQNRGRSPSQPPFNQPYMNQPPPAPHHDMPPDMPPIVRNITPKPLSNMPESHPASPAVKNALVENASSDGGMSGSMSQAMAGFQSPASITATADDGNSNMSDTPSTRPNAATPQPYGSMSTGKPNEIPQTTITNALNHAIPGVRSNTPKVSDTMNSPMPHVPRPDLIIKSSHMRRGNEMNSIKMNDPGMRPLGPSQYYPGSSSVGQEGYMSSGPYLPPPRGPERPPAPGMYQTPHSYHQTYSPYGGNSQMNVMRQYGQKRMPSMDNFGPPSKMPRPYNTEQQRVRGYPPRPEISTPHNYHPPYSQPTHPMRPYHPPGQHPSIQQHQRHLPMPRIESPATRPVTPDPHKSRTHIAHPPESASNFLKGLVSCPPMRPITGYYHHGSHFPQGSVEAVMPVGGKMKEKSGQDLGVIEAWQIIMSLKSGLHAESIWALNALTILLHDNRTVRQIILTQLPGLLNTIIEHYRFCLHQLFGISELDVTESRKDDLESEDSHPDAEKLATTMAMKCMSSPSTLNIRDKQVKYSAAPTKLLSPYCKLPVKMVAGDNNFPLLLDTLWKNPQKPAMSEFPPISGFKSKTDEDANIEKAENVHTKIRSQMDCNAERTEMTFEDMLSIPSFMRSNEHEKASRPKADDVKEEGCDKECKSEGSSNKVTEDIAKTLNDSPILPTATASGSTSSRPSDHNEGSSNTNASHIQSCLNRFAWDCDVALLEEEAAGFPGNIGFKAPSGVNSWHIAIRGLEYVFPKRPAGKDPELVVRALCLSNIVRSLSCAFANHYELSMHQNFFSSLCGTLLLGHKHRVRCTKLSKRGGVEFQYNNEESERRTDIDKLSTFNTSSALSTQNHLINANEITNNCPDSKKVNSSDIKSETDTTKSETTKGEVVVKEECETEFENCNVKKEPEEASIMRENDASCERRTLTTIEHDDRDYHDPWWWDCIRQLREDSLVVLANLSTSLNLSVLPGEGNALAILDACLHWCVCPSADAQDPSPTHSAQSLGIEILTKLSMKESNVDLILATKPYSRLEKFLKTLTIMSGNRQNPMLREFSVVLMCNLCGEESCARAVALQTGAISNFLSFLEECEETGLRHQRVFTAGQERINCGTVSYMMQKCALTLLKLARLEQNRPLFLKHQLRLVSLSMSGLLGNDVLSLLSAVLFELSREPPNR